MMREQWPILAAIVLLAVGAGCSADSTQLSSEAVRPTEETGFVSNQRIVYSDGLHNENTELIRLGDRILLAFRGGESGQVGSSRARIKIFESTDEGRTFSMISEVAMPKDPGNPAAGRDIRDPKLVSMGDRLFLYAVSRLPGFSYRDLFGEAWPVRAESFDGGRTWTEPVKTYADRDAAGEETFWAFWRFTLREYNDPSNRPARTLYATGYNDGDIAVGLFASQDGVVWEKKAIILSSYDDVPSEAELAFFGQNNERAVSLIRLDNQGVLSDGQTAICTSQEPFETWECGRRIEQRFDGPSWIVWRQGEQVRNFVFARKHLPCTFKRAAAYEVRGDLSDPGADVQVCEIGELKSSGDTAYTATAPLGGSRYLLSWYSSEIAEELAWLDGQFSPSDIWLADIDLSKAPETCTPPPAKRPCPPKPLPPGNEVFDVTGRYLLSVRPVIWPRELLYFEAEVTMRKRALDMTLQPLDPRDKQPVGRPWIIRRVPIAGDGSFTANFGARALPSEAYPVLESPIPLTIKGFTLTGKTVSADSFCGNVTGVVQLLPTRSDVVFLEGSTFGAVRIEGAVAPDPAGSCP